MKRDLSTVEIAVKIVINNYQIADIFKLYNGY